MARRWGPRGSLNRQAENKALLPRRRSAAAPGESLRVSLAGEVAPGARCAVRRPPTSGRAPAQSGQHVVRAGVKSCIYAVYTVSLRTAL